MDYSIILHCTDGHFVRLGPLQNKYLADNESRRTAWWTSPVMVCPPSQHEEPGPDVNVPPDRSDIWDEHVRPHFSNEYEFGAIYHHLMSCLFPPHLVEIEWICALSLCRRWCYTGLELIWCNAPDSRVISTSFCRDRIKEAFVVPSAFLKKKLGFWASHTWRRGQTLDRICIKVLLFFISWT